MQAAGSLFDAAKTGKIEEIHALLASGTDPDVLNERNVPAIWYAASKGHEALSMILLELTDTKLLSNRNSYSGISTLDWAVIKSMWNFMKAAVAKGLDPYANFNGQCLLEIINRSSIDPESKKALIAELKNEHIWSRRGPLVMLRRRFKQAWEAECDAREAAAAHAQSAAPDA